MTDKITKRGAIAAFQPKRRFARYSDLEHQHEYLRLTKKSPVRSHRVTPARFGDDPLEQRATHKVQGTILERIVYRRLEILLGPEGEHWVSQNGIGGARMFKGGFVLDFEVYWPRKVDIEVQGAFWHGPTVAWKDGARALTVLADGFEYLEIEEWEVYAGDEYLDWKLQMALGL